MKNNNQHKQAGFSLIEMILYMAVVSIFVTGAVLFGWNIIYGRIKSQVQLDVNYNLHLITNRVNYELRNATDILGLSASDLCLEVADSAHNPTRFYLSSGVFRVAWGGGSTDCTGMTNDQPLSNSSVSISSLIFTNLSSVGNETKNIKYSITVNSANPSKRQEWDKTQTYSSSVELRSN